MPGEPNVHTESHDNLKPNELNTVVVVVLQTIRVLSPTEFPEFLANREIRGRINKTRLCE
jgi:hypothetical protein